MGVNTLAFRLCHKAFYVPDADCVGITEKIDWKLNREWLKIVANSYRKTDSWMADPIMTEEAFTRLQDIIDINGELKARVEFGELVDNSFAEAVVKGK